MACLWCLYYSLSENKAKSRGRNNTGKRNRIEGSERKQTERFGRLDPIMNVTVKGPNFAWPPHDSVLGLCPSPSSASTLFSSRRHALSSLLSALALSHAGLQRLTINPPCLRYTECYCCASAQRKPGACMRLWANNDDAHGGRRRDAGEWDVTWEACLEN